MLFLLQTQVTQEAVLPTGERAVSSVPPTLYEVRYTKQAAVETLRKLREPLLALKKEVNALQEGNELLKSLVRAVLSDILYLYKHDEYKTEEEARMIVALDISASVLKQDDRIPPRIYVETEPFLFEHEGSSLIIGPGVQHKIPAELDLKYRLAAHSFLGRTSVRQSAAEYQ